jgi:uncharacterized membrane protein YeaQ/YmgE (transglycosylase-associated protein family)
MLHLIWYIIVGFLAGCVAKALMHTSVNHLDSGAWHCRLDHRRSGNASVLSAKRGRPISPRRLIVSILGAILVLYLWHKFRLQIPRG